MASEEKAPSYAEAYRQASISAPGLASEEDAAVLGKGPRMQSALRRYSRCLFSAKLGYKQELRRNFTMLEVFGIAFSIMGLLPSIASTLTYAIPAGPVGMVWVSAYPITDLPSIYV